MNISLVKHKIWWLRIAAGLLTGFVLIGLIFNVKAAQNQFNLNFPSCEAPQGQLKVNYPTGQHAIVGVQGLQYGSDKVYILDNGNYLQCFCPLPTGQGVQTNWLAAGGLSQEDKNNLLTQGWIYIYNGAEWGLQEQPYLAKNIPFNCGGGNGSVTPSPTPEVSSTPTPTPISSTPTPSPTATATPTTQPPSTSTPTPTPQPQGQVLGIQTLAPTSSSDGKYLLVGLLGLGLGLIGYGWYLKKQRSSKF